MFDPGTLYLTTDPTLKLIGAPSTLAHWRCEGKGPPFVKLGGRVAYRGADLNAWIDSQTVRPAAA